MTTSQTPSENSHSAIGSAASADGGADTAYRASYRRYAGVLLIDFPAAGQTTTDYEEFRQIVAKTARGDLRYVGIALRGPADVVRTLTKRLSVLR